MSKNMAPGHRSIRNKIVLGLLLAVFSILLPIEILEYFQLRQQMQFELESLSNQKIQRLAENLQLPLWELDKEWVEKVISSEMSVDYVFAVTVDSEGQFFAGKTRDARWQPVDSHERITGDFLRRDKEITRNGERIGIVRLYVTSQFLEKKLLLSISFEVLKSLILSLLLIVSLHVLLNRLVIFPLQNMLDVVNDIANGNYKRDVGRVEQRDEIGILAAAMQRMTESLRQASQAAVAVAEGDYTHRLEVRGPDDLFALAMNRMTESLYEAVKQIDIISLGNYQTHLTPRSEHDTLGIATERMTRALETFNRQHQQQIWLQQSIVALADVLRTENTIHGLANQVIKVLCRSMEAKVGALFLIRKDQDDTVLYRAGGYAYSADNQDGSSRYRMGEGLVGQVAMEQQGIVLQDIGEDDIKIASGLGSFSPHTVIISPFSFKNEIRGVLEVGFTKEITEIQRELLNRTQEAIASAFESIYIKDSLSNALAQSQVFSEELQATNEELLVKTEELEQQALELQESERISMERAKELEQSNRYKSEFLANMSHELRTPLNSLLILAKLLADNEQGNLSADQVESAQVIQTSGQHLLQLINEILDLSKVEAGRMTVKPSQVSFSQLIQLLQQRFNPLIQEKQLQFKIERSERLPEFFISDRQKLEQILTNLIGNSIKFTHQGSVSLSIETVMADQKNEVSEKWVRFGVSDTGVGIPEDQLKKIFAAFHQVDGSYSRRYGGTGLGLSIAQAYAELLGGRIEVKSKESEGSTFSLFLPLQLPEIAQPVKQEPAVPEPPIHTEKPVETPITAPPFADDRYAIDADDRVVLVLEDDPEFAKILFQQSKAQGYKCIVSSDAESTLQLAKRYSVTGIMLDLCLPGMDGKEFLQRLKATPELHHIPVHIISVMEDDGGAWQKGIVGYLTKPVTQQQINDALEILQHFERGKQRRLLILEKDPEQRKALSELLANEQTEIELCIESEEAVDAMRRQAVDCIILDVDGLENNGRNFLDRLLQDQTLTMPPIIVYTAQDLAGIEESALRRFTSNIAVNSKQSPERLQDEVALFLHQVLQKKGTDGQLFSNGADAQLTGKSAMIVDDDMRNSYALAKALRSAGMGVTIADSGAEAFSLLTENGNVDIVLMDIMMPEMDGYETIKKIRGRKGSENLPIIAVTAKAMPGDKERCLQVGANDYLTKPIDLSQLITMIRTWITN